MNQIPRKTLYLLGVFIIIVGVTAFVLWKGYLGGIGSKDINLEATKGMEITLNLSLLESEKVKKLNLFENVPEIKGKHKRNNPFSSYQGTSSE